jgi:hypothetical protein
MFVLAQVFNVLVRTSLGKAKKKFPVTAIFVCDPGTLFLLSHHKTQTGVYYESRKRELKASLIDEMFVSVK